MGSWPAYPGQYRRPGVHIPAIFRLRRRLSLFRSEIASLGTIALILMHY